MLYLSPICQYNEKLLYATSSFNSPLVKRTYRLFASGIVSSRFKRRFQSELIAVPAVDIVIYQPALRGNLAGFLANERMFTGDRRLLAPQVQ